MCDHQMSDCVIKPSHYQDSLSIFFTSHTQTLGVLLVKPGAQAGLFPHWEMFLQMARSIVNLLIPLGFKIEYFLAIRKSALDYSRVEMTRLFQSRQYLPHPLAGITFNGLLQDPMIFRHVYGVVPVGNPAFTPSFHTEKAALDCTLVLESLVIQGRAIRCCVAWPGGEEGRVDIVIVVQTRGVVVLQSQHVTEAQR